MPFNGATRLLANPESVESALPTRPVRPARPNWVHKAEQNQAQQPPKTNDIDEGTFSKEPSEIVNELKTKSTDFDQANSRLQYFINRSGSSDGATKNRLDQAKQQLYQSYGRELPPDSYGS